MVCSCINMSFTKTGKQRNTRSEFQPAKPQQLPACFTVCSSCSTQQVSERSFSSPLHCRAFSYLLQIIIIRLKISGPQKWKINCSSLIQDHQCQIKMHPLRMPEG